MELREDADLALRSAPPDLSPEGAEALVQARYGITATARRVASERDTNFHIRSDRGEFVLKLANPTEAFQVTDFQTQALLHLENAAPDLCVPKVVVPLDGPVMFTTDLPDGRQSTTRMLTWVQGTPMEGVAVTAPLRRDLGMRQGQLARALSTFAHPEDEHDLLWDMQRAARLRGMIPHLPDPDLRDFATRTIDDFDARIGPALARLRQQVVHNDLNPHNIVVADGRISGILDFGDMVRTALIADVAVAGAYLVLDGESPADTIGDLIEGYAREMPLQDAEIAVLPDLLVLRMVSSLIISNWRAARYPENAAYILRNGAACLRGIRAIESLGRQSLAHTFRRRSEGTMS